MGAAELGTALGFVSMIALGLLTYLGKGAKDDIRANEQRIVALERQVAVGEAARMPERVTTIERVLGAMQSDIRSILEKIERQDHHAHDRRADDRREGD